MRMMPCMAGWAGPTPTWMFWLPAPVPAPSPRMNSRAVGVVPKAITGSPRALGPSAAGEGCRVGLPLDGGPDEGLGPVDGIGLAEGVAHELLVEQEPAEVR